MRGNRLVRLLFETDVRQQSGRVAVLNYYAGGLELGTFLDLLE